VASDIDTYLRELQAALAGADPALVQDALFDAEEHLHAELAAGRDFSQIIDNYGTPAEVAAAYLEATDAKGAAWAVVASPAAPAVAAPAETAADSPDATVAPAASPTDVSAALSPALASAPPPAGPAPVAPGAGPAGPLSPAQTSVLRDILGVFIDPQVWKSLLYMLLSLGTGVAYFTVVVTMVTTSVSTSVLIIGLPLLLLTLALVRGMALAEGRLVEALLGTRMPRRPRAEIPGSFFQRLWFWLKDARTWASMVYLTLMLPVGIAYFTFAVTGIATGLGLIVAPFAWLVAGDRWVTWHVQGVEHVWMPSAWLTPISVIVGFLLLLGWFHAFRWIGRGHAAYAKAMLVRLAK
jgi:uncharacterized membrane protein